MKKLIYAVLSFAVLLMFAGCSQNADTVAKQTQNQGNQSKSEDIKQQKEQIYASVGGEKISQEEMDYECFRAKLQNALANKAEQNSCPPEKAMISQIVELKAVDYLAKEKGVTAKEEEVQKRIEKLKKDEANDATFQKMVASFGVDKFWKYEKQRYYTIINAENVKKKLMAEEKQRSSYLDDDALELTAQQSFDDLVVEAVGKVDTTIFYH